MSIIVVLSGGLGDALQQIMLLSPVAGDNMGCVTPVNPVKVTPGITLLHPGEYN